MHDKSFSRGDVACTVHVVLERCDGCILCSLVSDLVVHLLQGVRATSLVAELEVRRGDAGGCHHGFEDVMAGADGVGNLWSRRIDLAGLRAVGEVLASEDIDRYRLASMMHNHWPDLP